MQKAKPLKVTITVEGEHRGGKSVIATKIAYALRYAGIFVTCCKGVDPFDKNNVDIAYRNITSRSPIHVAIVEVPSPVVQTDCRLNKDITTITSLSELDSHITDATRQVIAEDVGRQNVEWPDMFDLFIKGFDRGTVTDDSKWD